MTSFWKGFVCQGSNQEVIKIVSLQKKKKKIDKKIDNHEDVLITSERNEQSVQEVDNLITGLGRSQAFETSLVLLANQCMYVIILLAKLP